MTTETGEPKSAAAAMSAEDKKALKEAKKQRAALREQRTGGEQSPADKAKSRTEMKALRTKIMGLQGKTPPDRAAKKAARAAEGGGKKRKADAGSAA